MKSLRHLAYIAAIVLSVAACTDSGKLTKDKAEATLNRWISSNGSVTVTGIQEVSQENVAKADLNFSNYKFTTQNKNSAYPYKHNYSGPGVAIFTHYNDGRWVLTRVSTLEGMASTGWLQLLC
jgi:hypothetical protein